MPLAAQIDGERIVAFLLDGSAWAALRADLKTGNRSATLSCGSEAFGRTSPLGTPHFVHKRGSRCDAHGPESPQHLLAKKVITEAAIEAGWDAAPEVPGSGGRWIADVLATRGNVKVALEVQWTRQDIGDYVARQERYAADGVRAAWFARHTRHIARHTGNDLPVFELAIDADSQMVSVGHVRVNLREAVTALLTRRLQYRPTLTLLDGTWAIDMYEEHCYRCKHIFTFWNVAATGISACGSEMRIESPPWPEIRLEAHPDVIRAIQAERLQSAPAKTGRRHSKTLGATYEAFICPRCRATAGDFFLEEIIDDTRPLRTLRLQISQAISQPAEHLCYVTHGTSCTPGTVLTSADSPAQPRASAQTVAPNREHSGPSVNVQRIPRDLGPADLARHFNTYGR